MSINLRSCCLSITMLISSTLWAGADNMDRAILHKVEVSPEGIVFTVLGQGCTNIEDFKLHAWPGKPISMVIERVRPDHCRGRRRAYHFQLSFDHLDQDLQQSLQKGERFILNNPLSALPDAMRKSAQ